MTRLNLLEVLKEETNAAVGQLIMPTKPQKGDTAEKKRVAEVFLMRLPDGNSAQKVAPYIIHQLITSKDVQKQGEHPESSTVVRSIFCVYCDNEQEGGLMLLNLMERLRIHLLRKLTIGDGAFQLDREQGIETICYPDDTAPFFAGEMISNWSIPAIEPEVRQWL